LSDLEGHPKAIQAYSCSSAIEDGAKRRLDALLRMRAIKTPLDAVRTAIVVEHKAQPMSR
jgi:hypothetical protein